MAERRLFLYFVAFVVPVVALVALLRPSADLAGHISGKTAAYQLDPDAFDILMLGDSRTYCAFHPPHLEALLGQRIANLASWAHWLPTQYAQISDLIDDIPPQTTVVWSVGYQNFQLCKGCSPAAYPVSAHTARFYAGLQLPEETYADNLQLTPLQPAARRFRTERLPEIYEAGFDWLMQPVSRGPPPPPGDLSPEARVAQLRAQPAVADAKLVYNAGKPTSIAVRFKAGGYERIELDPAFFRNVQKGFAGTRRGLALQAPYLALFEATLDLFAERNVTVIVNIMEESPHTYVSRDVQLGQRELMDTVVREAVEARGFAYVRIDWDRIESDAYFDYNHLNGRGARSFMALFAAAVQPELMADAGR